jgi:hypothetical protein
MGRARLQGRISIEWAWSGQRKWGPPADDVRKCPPSKKRGALTLNAACAVRDTRNTAANFRQEPIGWNLPNIRITRCIRLFCLRLVGDPKLARGFELSAQPTQQESYRWPQIRLTR